jgi:hypothetical protein
VHLSVPVAVSVMVVTNFIRKHKLALLSQSNFEINLCSYSDSSPNLVISVLFLVIVCSTSLEPCPFSPTGFAFLSTLLLTTVFPAGN